MATQNKEKELVTKIEERLREIGTFRPEFSETIKRTAALYVLHEKIKKQFKKAGGNAVIEYTTKTGATNKVKNPYLSAMNDVAGQLLAHEKELGLTPAALKKINESSMPRTRTGSVLGEALKKLS